MLHLDNLQRQGNTKDLRYNEITTDIGKKEVIISIDNCLAHIPDAIPKTSIHIHFN